MGSPPSKNLIRPYPAKTIIERSRLYQRLDNWQSVRVILVHAPAGYGKSSLVSRWIEMSGNENSCAWLSLQESDNDPHQFVYHIALALDRIAPGLLGTMQSAINSTTSDPQRILGHMLATLPEYWTAGDGASAAHYFLVLDDLHLISSPSVLSLLLPLLEDGPANLHLILLARQIAHLSLPRLVASGQVSTLTAADLRFTSDEVAQYLQARQISSSASELAQVMQRTEGWIAALQLAIASYGGRGSLADYLGNISGHRRWLAQYLTQEVLEQQRPAIREFLLHTAILNSFSAPLCVAVTGNNQAHRLLSEIHTNDLFLVQSDAEGVWFRYHHLLKELLQHRLAEIEEKSTIDELHRRAAEWLVAHNQLLPAIHHLQAAGDGEAAALVVENKIRAVILDNPNHAQRLFDTVPVADALRRPRLQLERCLLSIVSRNADLAFHIQNAERALHESAPSQELAEVFRRELLLYRAVLYYARGEYASIIPLTTEVQQQYSRLDRLLQGTLEFLLMLTNLRLPVADETSAQQHAWRALAAFKATRYLGGTIAVRRQLTAMKIHFGHTGEANREFERIMTTFDSYTVASTNELATIYHYAAEHHYWQNHLDLALRYQQKSMELAREALDDESLHYLTYFQWLCSPKADQHVPSKSSTAMVEKQERLTRPASWYRFLDWQIRWFLAKGWIEDAWGVAEDYQMTFLDNPSELSYSLTIPYLRAYIARGVKLEEVDSLLTSALEGSIAARDCPKQLELLTLRAWKEVQLGQKVAARNSLALAEKLIEKTGYVRMLLDIPALLPFLKSPLLDGRDLGESFEEANPLTRQEQAVLALLADEHTYAQIAEELVISINTVRTHVRHIYKKLGATRRDQAVQRALEWAILS